MTLTKMVNGEVVPLTPSEIAEIEARQAEYEGQAPERLKAEILAAAQARLDAFARERNYDNIMSACTYARSTVPTFAAEGQACVALRDQTWAALYTMLGEVEEGTRPLPSSFDDIKGDLPELIWP